MKEKKKQSTVIVVTTILTVTSVMSPVASVYANETDTAISQQTETVQIKENAPPITLPQDLVGNEGQSLQDIVLPENWKWSDETTVISKTKTEYPARFSVDDVTYDYSNEEGYNAEGHYVERMVEITVELENSEPVKQEQVEVVQKNSRMLKENNPTTSNAGDIEINDTNFPDKILRDWLEAQHYGQDGKITQDEIADITKINVTFYGTITNLTGIEHFTALTDLYCDNTGITSLDVSKNTKLAELYCSNTPLAYLNIGVNKGLTVDKSNLINPTVYVATDTFMLTDKFSGIDITKISNLTGADWNPQTGEVYHIKSGTPITYVYNCGTSINGTETLNVTLTVTDELAINATNFPDKGFRDWLEQQSYGQDGKITQNEIAGITEIDVSGHRNIEDLTGIEHFTALTKLLCHYSGISSLDVSKNTQLTYLNCYNTGISELDVSKNTKLTTLYCASTGITSLDVSNNTQLTTLDCAGNGKLAKLTVAGATELTYLSCSKIGISDLDVSKNTKLTDLFCDNIGITSLDVSKNTQLTRLFCDNTGITSLDVSKNTKLTDLFCDNTGITSLDVSKNTQLTRLFCENTGITSLDVSNNSQLTRLDCFETPLAYLNVGANNNLTIDKTNLKPVSLEITEDSFNMADKFIGIELSNVTNVSGADYKNGIMSNYDVGTPITYTYACGTSKNGVQTIDVTLNLTGSFITITDDMNKTYDGIAVNASPTIKKSGSTGAVSFVWEKKVNGIWKAIASAPTDAGAYRVTASLASDSNYKGATNTMDFVISQATNSWINDLAITDWTFGDQPKVPTAKAMFGDKINYLYSDSEKGIYTDKVPTTAGTWYMKATVADSNNYNGLESIVSFTIAPKNADNNSQIIIPDINSDKDVENLVIRDGDKELEKGTDYDVDKKQNDNEVIVSIIFKGNYTGTITKTYTVNIETPKDEPKETASIPTGDNTHTGLLAMISLLSASCVAFLKKDKKSMK